MSNSNSYDPSFSGYESTPLEPLSREFTEVTFVRETDSHQLFRAKRFGRWYLLKALPPRLRQSEFHLQMLRKEMEILMQLQHPNIVGCLGMESLPDYTDSEGHLISIGICIVLEYIDGQTLADLLATSSPTTPSSTSNPSSGDVFAAEEFLDNDCESVYQLVNPDLAAAGGDDIYTFDFSYRGGTNHNDAYLMNTPGGLFLFAGDKQEFPLVSLAEETTIDDTEEPVEEEIDELDFSMF